MQLQQRVAYMESVSGRQLEAVAAEREAAEERYQDVLRQYQISLEELLAARGRVVQLEVRCATAGGAAVGAAGWAATVGPGQLPGPPWLPACSGGM
jgi:hypothetical protein